jgi:2'-5' RNA ligase
MRLFIAIDFSPEVKQALCGVTTELERQASAGRMVPLENYHLTLAFIGETQRVAEVDGAMGAVCRAFGLRELGKGEPSSSGVGNSNEYGASEFGKGSPGSPVSCGGALHLVLQGIGSFKGKGSVGYTWWAGIRVNPALARLAQQLTGALRDAGFAIEKRNFTPHITLGRGVITKRPVELELPPLEFETNRVSLMRSDHKQGRPVYTELSAALTTP